MAKLTDVYRAEDVIDVGYRQIPVVAGSGDDSSLMMLMDLSSKGLCIDSPQIRGRELEIFTRKYKLLSPEELRQSLEIDSVTFVSLLNQCVPCVGCRRRVERLFYQLTLSGHPTLDPLVLKDTCVLTIREERVWAPQALGTLLYRHHEVLSNLLDNKLRNKTRCVLHSLDAFRTRPFSEVWREVWFSMKYNCRDELATIETKELHEVLENYLKKHKFCQGCRNKIEKAYQILVNETTCKEGFDAALYASIKRPQTEKHIQILTKKVDFLDALIRRAEPEVNGSYSKQRERHAKTLEIAQEEVLTCVGMIMYERLRRIYVSLREEERACQVLAAVGVHALSRSFDMAVERKQGISNLELLYQEISRAEKAKELRREQKKLKKKLKKMEKKEKLCRKYGIANDSADSDTAEADEEEEDEQEEDVGLEMVDKAVDLSEELNEELNKLVVIMDDNLRAETNEESMSTDKRHLSTVVESKSAAQKKRKQKKQKKHKQTQQNASGSKKKPLSQEQHQRVPTVEESPSAMCNAYDSCCVIDGEAAAAKCDVCLTPQDHCPCENDVRDSGYGSELLTPDNSPITSAATTPEGSEVSCSDGFCNHENGQDVGLDDEHNNSMYDIGSGYMWRDSLLNQKYGDTNWLSLQQMLDNVDEYDDDEENGYIPQEVVLEYQCQREKVEQQRLKLRETLRQNFARLCKQHKSGKLPGSNTVKCSSSGPACI
ncbi:PREDICTED: gametogenetin-binding protein 2-like [Rhagoletis zephyria]|uniref:gametogenetin-binding protein 2-like n=1 Tax=Rhagoletis zephyria TaxID=28612 RepID=UPI0008115E56|nr:PREDICTED: gametogenetin-binding protein 2-like [Rhagoletis zephyria]